MRENKVKGVKIQLRVLNLQLGEVIRQYKIVKAVLLNLEKELLHLAQLLRQEDAKPNGVST